MKKLIAPQHRINYFFYSFKDTKQIIQGLFNFNSLAKQVIFSFLLLINSTVFCQLPNLKYAKGFENAIAISFGIDLQGNTYTTGYFSDTVDFDPGPASFKLIASTSNRYSNFLLKLDSIGNFVWVKKFDSDFSISSLHLYKDSSIYFTGQLRGTVDFDPGVGTYNLTGLGTDIYICNLDINGDFKWAKRIGGTSGNEWSLTSTITTNHSGNLFISGNFRGAFDFDPGNGVSNLSTASSGGSLFLAKFDLQGNFVWAKKMGQLIQIIGVSNYPTSIVFDSTNTIYMSGVFNGSGDFDPGVGTFNLSSTGQHDVFVMRLDSLGNFVWAKQIGGSDYDVCYSMAIDYNYLYLAGSYRGSIDFDPGVSTYNLYASGEGSFILKLDHNGNFDFVKSIDGYSNALSINLDSTGNIYASGFFTNPLDFDPGSGVYILTPAGNAWKEDIYLLKLTNNGNFEWAFSIGDIGVDKKASTKINSKNEIYCTGRFQDTVDFDPTLGTYNLFVRNNNVGSFVLKLTQSNIVNQINTFDNRTSLRIFPNPSSGKFIFNGLKKESLIEIYNITGRLIFSEIIQNTLETIDLTCQTKGMYFFKIISDKNEVQQGKLILQ